MQVPQNAKRGVRDRVYAIVGEKPINIVISVLDKAGGVLLYKPCNTVTNTALLEAADEAAPYTERIKAKHIAVDRPTQDLFWLFSSKFRNFQILSLDPVHIVMAIGPSYIKGTRERRTEWAMRALTSRLLASSASKDDLYRPISEFLTMLFLHLPLILCYEIRPIRALYAEIFYIGARKKPPSPLQSLSEYTESAYAIINGYSAEASKRTTRGRTIKELLESHVMCPSTMAFLWKAVVYRSGLRGLDKVLSPAGTCANEGEHYVMKQALLGPVQFMHKQTLLFRLRTLRLRRQIQQLPCIDFLTHRSPAEALCLSLREDVFSGPNFEPIDFESPRTYVKDGLTGGSNPSYSCVESAPTALRVGKSISKKLLRVVKIATKMIR